MKNKKTIKILDKEYIVLDVLEHITMADSFVLRNKTGRGHGEAKLYIGSRQKYDKFSSFFNNFEDTQGFFLREDLNAYLEDAKFEYENQEQGYTTDIFEYWSENKRNVKNLNDIEQFTINESRAGGSRFYIEDPKTIAFKVFRQILLPTITYVAILKIKSVSDPHKILYYFRPFLDYFFDKRSFIERIERDRIENKPDEKKNINIKNARIGQGSYRISILEEFPEGCLITKINDERLLIASHIKPWAVSSDDEKISRYNGLLLSPTYDKLFDQGFITFDNDGTLHTSPYISPLNWRKLQVRDGQKFDLKEHQIRNKFLEYHRLNVFKA